MSALSDLLHAVVDKLSYAADSERQAFHDLVDEIEGKNEPAPTEETASPATSSVPPDSPATV